MSLVLIIFFHKGIISWDSPHLQIWLIWNKQKSLEILLSLQCHVKSLLLEYNKGPDKNTLSIRVRLFSYQYVKAFVWDAPKNHLIQTFLLGNHICFC